jgi:hypothetical protein
VDRCGCAVTPAVDVEIRSQPRMSAADRDAMFALHSRFFDNLQREHFDADLAEKQYVILLRAGGQVVGFSTIRAGVELFEDRSVAVIFSGDTCVNPDYWRHNALMPSFGAFLKKCLERYAPLPVYWNLLSKGFRTYLMLPFFFRCYHPCASAPSDPFERRLADSLGERLYGGRYDAGAGVARLGGERDFLRSELAGIPPLMRDNRHVAFFLARNPGYGRGDELVCLARVCEENMTRAAVRLLETPGVRWVE